MILNSPTISGSLTVTGSLTVFTGSLIEFQVLNTGTKIGNAITDTHTVTGSLSVTGSNTLIGIKTITGSVFISGSKTLIGTNTVSGSMLVSGSLNVNGPITATTLIVQTITSSVSTITGSTQFGTLSSNTHIFTGSMYVTGAFYVTTGSVGIGTTNPSAKLDVWGTILSSASSPSNTVGAGPSIYLSGNSGSSYTYLQQGLDRFIYFGYTGGSWYERLTINNVTGNVGIGTTSPGTILTVFGTATGTESNIQQSVANNAIAISNTNLVNGYSPGLVWYTSDSNSTKPFAGIYTSHNSAGSYMYFGTSNGYSTGITQRSLIIDPNGNVGIGTSSPSAPLHILGTSTITNMLIENTNASGYALYQSKVNGSAYTWQFGGWANGSFRIGQSGVGDFITIATSGNVGIGTTSPGSALEVNGGIYSSTGQLGSTKSVTISALNTSVLLTATAFSGIITARDNTNGGSGIWLQDPNGGTNLISQNWVNGTYTVFYSGGNTYVQKTSGNVPITFHYALYGN
jgi:hypothetical protein